MVGTTIARGFRAVLRSQRNLLHGRLIAPAASAPAFASTSSSTTRHFVPLRTYASGPPTPQIPTNYDIPHKLVHLVSPENGQLLPLQSLSRVIDTIDLSTHFLQLVSTSPPIVRIYNIAEHEEALVKAREKQRERADNDKDKEIQISWNSADGDLAMKLKTAKGLIERGEKVHLIFAPRKARKRVIIPDKRINEILQIFHEGLEGVAKKYREDEDVGKVKTCYWQPKGEVKQEASQKISAYVNESRSAREEKKAQRRKKDEERRLASEAKRREELSNLQQRDSSRSDGGGFE